MTRHWSEQLSCQCGKRFRSVMAEARHRHNFPLLCQPGWVKYKFRAGARTITVRTRKGSLHARVLAERKLKLTGQIAKINLEQVG